MNKIAILSDSSVRFSEEFLKKNLNLKILKLGLNLKTELRSINPKDDLKYYLSNNLISTSQISISKISEIYSNILNEYNKIIVFSISKKLSSAYYNFLKISKKTEYKNKVFVVDNLTTSALLGEQIKYCLNFIEKNKKNDLKIDEFLKNINVICQDVIKNQKNFIFLNSLMPLINGGRVNKKIIKLSEKLKLKFALTLKNGELKKVAKLRTLKKGMIKFLNKTISNKLEIIKIDVKYSEYENVNLKKYLQKFLDQYQNLEITYSPFSNILLSHLGVNVIGITIWIKK